MTHHQLSGIFAPIPTPFRTNGDLALAQLARNFEYWGRFPLAGYVVLGSSGEAVHLDEDETRAVLGAAREAIPADRLMIAGVSRQGTRETIAWCERAAEIGAGAALVLPPAYYWQRKDAMHLESFFTEVADASPLPVILYNMPACTGIDLDATTISRLAKHDNIVGLKDSGGDVAKLGEVRAHGPDDFAILAGSAGFLLPALSVGAGGGVLGLANVAPGPCCEILAAARAGGWSTAQEIQLRMIRPNRMITRQWGVPGLKDALDLVGLYGGPPRAPLLPLDRGHSRLLRIALTEAGIPVATEGDAAHEGPHPVDDPRTH